jgi:Tfp pilus assembly protein PilE
MIRSSAGFTPLDVIRTLAVLTLLSLLSMPVLTNVQGRPSPPASRAR